MSNDALAVKVAETWRLYKWDGGFAPEDPTKIDAQNHPLCVEIWEMEQGQPPKLIHKRN